MNNFEETNEYYFDGVGRLTYKAEFHLQRGECCFHNCLHCPYGTTVEKFGFHIQKIHHSLLQFSLKGHPCAEYDLNSQTWKIYPRFQKQNLEDDLISSLRTLYKDKGEL